MNLLPQKSFIESLNNWNCTTITFSSLLPFLFISIFLFKVIRSWIVGGSGDQCGIPIGLPASSSWRLGHKSPFQHSGAQSPFSPLAESPPPSSPLHLPDMALVLLFAWIKKRLLCFPSPCLSPGQRTEVYGLNEITVCVCLQCVWFLLLNQHVEFRRWMAPVGVVAVHLKNMSCFKFTLSMLNTTTLVTLLNIQPLLTVFLCCCSWQKIILTHPSVTKTKLVNSNTERVYQPIVYTKCGLLKKKKKI